MTAIPNTPPSFASSRVDALYAECLDWPPVRLLRLCWAMACGNAFIDGKQAFGPTELDELGQRWPLSQICQPLRAICKESEALFALLTPLVERFLAVNLSNWNASNTRADHCRILWLKALHARGSVSGRLAVLLLRRLDGFFISWLGGEPLFGNDRPRNSRPARKPSKRKLSPEQAKRRAEMNYGRELVIDELAQKFLAMLVLLDGTTARIASSGGHARALELLYGEASNDDGPPPPASRSPPD
ncbi:MAG: hypothetical protein R3D03_20695 [Geminicoccaceae bacterium]